MNPTQELVYNFQELLGQVPEFVQPFILMLAAAVPFLEGEAGALIGVVGGLNPVLAAVAAALGNFASVALVVLLTSGARTAVTNRADARAEAAAAAAGGTTTLVAARAAKPESKGRLRFKRWLVRFGTVPDGGIWQAGGGGFQPYRRRVDYLPGHPVPLEELRGALHFTAEPNWGYQLRRGLVVLDDHDASLIRAAMTS